MNDQQNLNSFTSYIKELTLPISTFIGIVIFMLEFREKIDLFSIKLISIIMPLFFLLWLIYVWTKRPDTTESKSIKIYPYKRSIRFGAIFGLVLSFIPLYFVIISFIPLKIKFQIENKTNESLDIKFLNNYNILIKAGNGFEYIIDSGLMSVKNTDGNNLTVKPKSKNFFVGNFEDQSKLKSYLTGDYWISLDVRTNNNAIINCDKMLHLTRERLDDSYLLLCKEPDIQNEK